MKLIQRVLTSPPMQGKVLSRWSTKLFGFLANCRMPYRLLRYIIDHFSESYQVNTSEFDLELENLKTFQQFFVREFKPGARSFNGDIASPVEGTLTAIGQLKDGTLLQVKGLTYRLDDLVLDEGFASGSYMIIYLALGDYHHVHMPLDGVIKKAVQIKGAYYSTNLKALGRRKDVYAKNERLILKGESRYRQFYLVMVGATCVGKIEPNLKLKEMQEPVTFRKGDRLGSFHMGSTVVLVFEDDDALQLNRQYGERLLLGQRISKSRV